jgi:hypothetical protein
MEMLQTIHDEYTTPRASSLYCVWIPSRQVPGAPLIALWIDDQMRAFETNSLADVPAGYDNEEWNEQVR